MQPKKAEKIAQVIEPVDDQGRPIRYDACGDPILPKQPGGRWVGNQKTE